MTRKTNETPELFGDKIPPITEGRVRKGGQNQGPSQVKERPAAPKPMSKREMVVHGGEASPPALREPKSFLEVIMQAALDPRCDTAKMEALLSMQERIETAAAKKAFTAAFAKLQEELPVIDKDGVIDHGEGRTARGNAKLKARWATYPNLMAICNPLLKKNGFTLAGVVEPSADGSKINVVSYLTHNGGHERISRFPMTADSTGGKNNQQGWGSSQQYAMRYNAIMLLNIITKDPRDIDNDGFAKSVVTETDNSPRAAGDAPKINEEQAMQLREAIESCGVTLKTFKAKFRVEAVADLPASEFNNALASCANYRKAKNG